MCVHVLNKLLTFIYVVVFCMKVHIKIRLVRSPVRCTRNDLLRTTGNVVQATEYWSPIKTNTRIYNMVAQRLECRTLKVTAAPGVLGLITGLGQKCDGIGSARRWKIIYFP